MNVLVVLSTLLSAAFLTLAAWTTVQWARHRTRPNALLAVAFTSLAMGIVISRVDQLTPLEFPAAVLQALNFVLAAFPWLIAAAVWSLGTRRPRWSWIGIVGVPTVSVWVYVFPVSGDPPHPLEEPLLIVAFVLLWTIAAVATAVRLRRAAGRHAMARPRMRWMAVGLLATNAALLLDILAGATQSPLLEAAMNAVAVVAATIFMLGFIAPRPLRWWWRGATMPAFQQTQSGLLAAVTESDVAAAVTPRLAELLGSAVFVMDDHGEVLERSGIDAATARTVAARVLIGATKAPDVRTASVGRGRLVVVANPYTPLFGQEEADMLDAFASQTRIALERAQLVEVIATQHRDLEAMLLGLAHDIRNPAVTIRGFAELQVETDDLDQRREFAEHIATSTAYLDRLVDAMMELGQVRRADADREPVELRSVARQVADRLSTAHPAIRIDVAGGDATVVMSRLHAEQLIDNLLANAVKHGGRDDLTISVHVAAPNDNVEVVVADDGVGVPEDDRERIFAPFQRGGAARGEGNGLGLGLANRIVENLGGRLSLEPSERGARFVIHLPAHHPGPERAAAVTGP